jgi:serine/threonine protein kinase
VSVDVRPRRTRRPSSIGVYNGGMATREPSLAATVPADNVPRDPSPSGTTTTAPRSAVLPRGDGGDLAAPGERYAKKRTLGAGGMGEVVLAEDRDIGRDVAVKYLTAPSSDAGALARFVDEIRVVGSLEHPNIVPIHDVGVDDADRYYFVMKHVEGETLEQVIEKLAAGDAAYHAKYTYTARVQLFLALLQALSFAHERGYVHRDIKPANVMVGRHGEVVLMDWGVAKRRNGPEFDGPEAAPDDASRGARERLFTTRRGAIVGTPMYMSPEQARGDVDAIDERSDVYCATALLYELVTLRHHLGDVQTLEQVLGAIQNEEPRVSFGATTHPTQGPPPAEFIHFVKKGLQKNPAARHASVNVMIDELEAALDGRVKVQCPFTLQKRLTRELARFTDRHPAVSLLGFVSVTLGTLGAMAWAAVTAWHAL